jgi:hypothetical protein
MPDIRIDLKNGYGDITVDGQKLPGVMRFGVDMAGAGELPVLTVDIAAFDQTLDLSGAVLKIGGIEAPEALERAMLAFLTEKYARKVSINIDVRPAVRALHDASDEILRSMQGAPMFRPNGDFVGVHEGVAIKSGEKHKFACGGPLPAGQTYIVGEGVSEQCRPRGAISTMAADLIALPVREMTATGEPPKFTEVQLSTTDAAFLESEEARRQFWGTACAPAAGLTTVATDGERNGRLTWTPGA